MLSSPVFWQKAARIHPLACIPLGPAGDIVDCLEFPNVPRRPIGMPVAEGVATKRFSLSTGEDYGGSSRENRINWSDEFGDLRNETVGVSLEVGPPPTSRKTLSATPSEGGHFGCLELRISSFGGGGSRRFSGRRRRTTVDNLRIKEQRKNAELPKPRI